MRNFTIAKAEPDKMLVFGWANIAADKDGAQVEDLQGDIVDADELEKAAYDHVLHFRSTGEKHDPHLRHKGRLVESCVFTKEKQAAMGIPDGILPCGWWVGYKVDDPEAWDKIKNGDYQMFSVEGKGKREEIKKSRVAKSYRETLDEIKKFNPYHDRLGRFTTSNGAFSFTYKPNGSAAHRRAIASEKERNYDFKDALKDTKRLKIVNQRIGKLRSNIKTVRVANTITDEAKKRYERALKTYEKDSAELKELANERWDINNRLKAYSEKEREIAASNGIIPLF